MRATDDYLLEFLESKRDLFIIPVYQRNYDWKIKNCQKLFDDVVNLKLKNLDSYFVGSIVTYPNNSKSRDSRLAEKLIIDGQQRITTLFLILLALRDQIEENHLDQYKDILTAVESIILNIQDKKLKLKSVKSDDEALQNIIKKESSDKFNLSNILINYTFFKNAINESKLTPSEILDSLYKLQIVNITLEKDKDNPQLIFESLNSTGVDLSAADLIRNFLLMELSGSEQEDFYFKYWQKIEDLTQFRVQDLIRHYLTLKTKKIPKKNDKSLYESFKAFFILEDISKENFLKELLKFSNYYSSIVFANHSNKQIAEILRQFKKIEVSVSYPYLLSLWNKLDNDEVKIEQVIESLKVIESFIIRRIICEVPTSALNKIFMNLPYEIAHPKLKEVSYEERLKYCLCRKKSSQRFPEDKEFYESFISKNVYKMKPKNKIYIIEAIENHDNKERVDIENLLLEKQISIEHIMPQKLNSKWKKELGNNYIKIHEDYLHKIGNLTLTAFNSAMGNKSFDEKKNKGFMDSRFKLNKSLAKSKKWTEREIISRGELLSDIALKRWKYHNSSKTVIQELENETFYELSNSDDFSGKKVEKIEFFGNEFTITGGHWRTMYQVVCEELYNLAPQIFTSLLNDANFGTGYRKFISTTITELSRPVEVGKNLWLEGNLSAASICKWIAYILSIYDLDESELQIYLKEKGKEKNQISINF
ncbi:hypothetical protein AWE51_08805 [Aquimarina aggregata]|uniref:DUF262 domain-containing protein n=1 Tax=Aquimarina aggregata TaxID=1642818 RepID=A0A162ZE02_9FLAO|nr:DUF262 domain-containing protein [Aquimarina aggregata]KZS39740.1 hypothetical protein AWE51_08805 [Aquimarina aggregata]